MSHSFLIAHISSPPVIEIPRTTQKPNHMKKPTIPHTKASLAATGASLLIMASAGNINAQTASSESAVSAFNFAAGKIANGSVTSKKLAKGSVTTSKLADGSVTTPKLANGSVTLPKLHSSIGVWMADGPDVFWNGKVGIGTNTPDTQLQIGSYESADQALRISTSGGNLFTASIDFRHFNALNGFSIVSDERGVGPSGLHFIDATGVDRDTRMFIENDSGNIGIGTTAPATKLDVAGTVSATAVRAPGAGINTGTFAFVHRATVGSISGHITTIDNAVCNGDSNAILIVTHNWTKDTSADSYHPQVVGVYYTAGKWTIFHEDNATAMQSGDAFNVMVIKP